MTEAVGSGTVGSALQRRLERPGAVASSLLGAPAAVALGDVGFEPAGDVLGCAVMRIGFAGAGGCSWAYGGSSRLSAAPAAVVSSRSGPFAAYGPYRETVERGYDLSLGRLLDEARALGAHGVVGVRLTVTHLDRSTREFTALGTAVRARTTATGTPSRPFATLLAGPDVAALLHSGWVPVGIAVGLEVALRHDDWATWSQQQLGAGNVEVSGYTELVQEGRALARRRFAERLAGLGAEGGVVSDLGLRVWEVEPSDGHRDHVAEAYVLGTGIVRFTRRRGAEQPPRTLSILPVRPWGAGRGARQ